MPSSTLVTTAMPRTSTGREQGLFSPMPWAARTETCRICACGPIIQVRWPRLTACRRKTWVRFPTPCWRVHLALTRTPCPVNWPTSFQAAWPTCSICKVQTTPWTLLAPPPWQPCWTHADCCKPARWTSCSPVHRTVPWTPQRLRNSLPSARFHHRTPHRLMPVRTGSSWAKAPVFSS